MSMVGHIEKIDGALFVRYEYPLSREPVKIILRWRIDRVARDPFAIGSYPEAGDEVTSNMHGWSGKGYSVHFPGGREAEHVAREPVQCPPTRGKQVRWNDGRWEKLMARGWVPA